MSISFDVERALIMLLCGGDERTQERGTAARRRSRRRFRKQPSTSNDDAGTRDEAQDNAVRFQPTFSIRSELQIELLADAVELGDSRYIANALGTIARARGMAKVVAGEPGLTRQALYRSLSAAGDPRLTTLLSVAKSLGLKLSFKAA